MELKEYIKIIRHHYKLFLLLLVLPIFASLVWYANRPQSFDASMSIEVGRKSIQKTDQYQYDQYYRLEADNDFSDSVEQWLKDPAVVFSIFSSADIPVTANSLRALEKSFRSEKLAPSYLRVSFRLARKEDGEKIALAIKNVLSDKTDRLNSDAQSEGWFELIFGKPILVRSRVNLAILLGISLIGGFILAIMGVLFWRYMKSD